MIGLRIALVATLLTVAGCSTSTTQSAAPLPRTFPIAATMDFISTPYAEAPPVAGDDAPRFCHLSRDCMDLDSRPFEPCLVGGGKCEGEGGFIRTAPPDIIRPEDNQASPGPGK
jgi:hypothetical protein